MKISEIYSPTTKNGLPITFKYEENVGPFGSKLWKYDSVIAYVNEEEAGYIKIAYIPKAWVKKYFPSILNYMAHISGTDIFDSNDTISFDDPNYDQKRITRRSVKYKTLSDDDLREVIKQGYWKLKDIPYYNKEDRNHTYHYGRNTELDSLDDELREKLLWRMKEIEKTAKRKAEKYYRNFIEYHVDKPEPHYIQVEEKYKGMGVGRALYMAAGRWLAERGLKLYSSTTITGDAKAAWDRMEKQGHVEKYGDRNILIPENIQNTDPIDLMIKKSGYTEEDREDATQQFCGVFALALYRHLIKRHIPAHLVIFVERSDTKIKKTKKSREWTDENNIVWCKNRDGTASPCWHHFAVKVYNKYYDITGLIYNLNKAHKYYYTGDIIEITEKDAIKELYVLHKSDRLFTPYSFKKYHEWKNKLVETAFDDMYLVKNATFERCQHGNTITSDSESYGEAGYGVYAYPVSNRKSMRPYYSSQGENVFLLKMKPNATMVDLTKPSIMNDLIAYTKSIYNKRVQDKVNYPYYNPPKVYANNIQRLGFIEEFVRNRFPNVSGWIVPHEGPGIPSGKQAVIRKLEDFIITKIG